VMFLGPEQVDFYFSHNLFWGEFYVIKETTSLIFSYMCSLLNGNLKFICSLVPCSPCVDVTNITKELVVIRLIL
jgi:hypothetical protein